MSYNPSDQDVKEARRMPIGTKTILGDGEQRVVIQGEGTPGRLVSNPSSANEPKKPYPTVVGLTRIAGVGPHG